MNGTVRTTIMNSLDARLMNNYKIATNTIFLETIKGSAAFTVAGNMND